MKRSLIVVAMCVFALVARAADMPDFPFVFVYGSAEREAPPNMAAITLDIEVYSEDPTNGLRELNDNTAAVAACLLNQGVDRSDIMSFDIKKTTKHKRVDYEELEILGYAFGRDMRVTIRDLRTYKVIAERLQSMPNTTDIRTEFDRDDRIAIAEELLIEATEDSKRRGAVLAKAYNAALGSIYAVSEQGFYDLGMHFGLGEMHELQKKRDRRTQYSLAAPQKTDITFLPKTMTFKQTITAIFRLNVDE